MRRCLHAFLIAVLTLAPSMDAARACWHLRARRQCRPARVVTHCPPPVWSACGEVVVVRECRVPDGCCQPVVCPPVAACCGEEVVANAVAAKKDVESKSVADAGAAEPESRSVVAENPTLATPGEDVASVTLEQVPLPAPQAEAPAQGDAVVPTSNDQPAGAAVPAEAKDDAAAGVDPEMRKDVDPLPATDADAPPSRDADEPEMVEEESPAPVLPPITGLDAEEPPMDEDADPAPAEEPAPAPEPTPEPAPQPEPAEPNLFEEFDDAPAAEEEMADDEQSDAAAANPFADDEPAPPASEPADPFADAPADEPGPLDELLAGDDEVMAEEAAAPADAAVTDEADPSGDDPAPAAGEEAPPVEEDEPLTAADDPADPFADEPAPAAADDEPPMEEEEPLPAAADEPAAEPEPAPFEEVAVVPEPARRWIHATGAYSLVATLVDVAGDGTCVLETEGRRLRVPLDNLSGHDREYVREAGVRLAALRDQRERAARAAAAAAPQAIETAGL